MQQFDQIRYIFSLINFLAPWNVYEKRFFLWENHARIIISKNIRVKLKNSSLCNSNGQKILTYIIDLHLFVELRKKIKSSRVTNIIRFLLRLKIP